MNASVLKIFTVAAAAGCLIAVGRAAGADDFTLSWTNNMLTVSSPRIPGERVETLYLEAFCKKGSTNRTWDKTTIPHTTKLVRAINDGKLIELESNVEQRAKVFHEIRSVADGVEFRLTVTNLTNEAQDIDWAQPCLRVGRFTQRKQEDYWPKCFIFTERGLTMLDQLPRNEEAIYKGGQVFVPPGVNREDVNPRPLSSVVPVNGLTGAVSADGKMLLAAAWDHTQELFQGVIVCMHSDFRIGGLRTGETKKIFGKFYVMENDPAKLLRVYQKDFPHWREDMLDLRGPREPVLRCETDAARSRITFLSWDTEGGERAQMNLLRAGTAVALVGGGEACLSVTNFGARLVLNCNPGKVDASGKDAATPTLVFPFDPRVTATGVLPHVWADDGTLELPAVINAPDFGPMLLADRAGRHLQARLVGSRANKTVDLIVDLPLSGVNQPCELQLTPVQLPAPKELHESELWRAVRRAWLNVFQPSAQWGDQGNPFSAPAGILANNVVSDPVSCLISLYGDAALLTPEIAPGISVAPLVRRTVDWWLDARTRPSGEVVAYWNHGDMLDANASPLIAAWDYVEATRDTDWLKKRVARLEVIADYLAKRDTDDDGLVESTHSGNAGTLADPQRADSAYDTINAGHKNAYCNALTYRAWRCLADLEGQLRRREQQARYTRLAGKLKAAYSRTFFNPTSGLLAWWKSADGELHDYASPMINSLAIEYGLVDVTQGRAILARLWKKIEDVGFRRFDLGVPITLLPIRRGDYLSGLNGFGVPQKDDGSDTFGEYLNGGCLVSDAVHLMVALHMVGESAKADAILQQMLGRQVRGVFPNGGGFQNGVVDRIPDGAEFYTWDGKPCGYEGYLTYSFSFLQAVLLREPAFRARLYRPLAGR